MYINSSYIFLITSISILKKILFFIFVIVGEAHKKNYSIKFQNHFFFLINIISSCTKNEWSDPILNNSKVFKFKFDKNIQTNFIKLYIFFKLLQAILWLHILS